MTTTDQNNSGRYGDRVDPAVVTLQSFSFAPFDRKPSPVRTNRFGLIAADLLVAALVAETFAVVMIPSPLPPQ